MACSISLDSHVVMPGMKVCQPLLSAHSPHDKTCHAASCCSPTADPCSEGCPPLIPAKESHHKAISITDGKKRVLVAAAHVTFANLQDDVSSNEHDAAMMIAEETLDGVLRNPLMPPRDKLRQLQQACSGRDGWIVAWALNKNGWNSEQRCMEVQPSLPDAVRRLAHGICSVRAAGAIQRPPKDSKPIFVAVDASLRSASACSLALPRSLLLSSAIRLASLRSLCLAEQNIAPRHLAALLPLLAAHPRITDLDLSRNPLHEAGAALLVGRLAGRGEEEEEACRWEQLDLSACLFPTKGCVALLLAAKAAPKLRGLSLSSNDVGGPGGEAAGELLASNGPLEALLLNSAGITLGGMESIVRGVMANSRVTSLLLEDNAHAYTCSWRLVVERQPHLHHLALEAPAGPDAEQEAELLCALARARSPSRVREEMESAVAMGLHCRLGAQSPLRLLNDHLLLLLLQLAAHHFRLDLVQSAPAAADFEY